MVRGHVHMMSAQGGGEGGTPKADAVRKLSKGGCVKMKTRRGRGVIKSDNFADMICTWPLCCDSPIAAKHGASYVRFARANNPTF